MSNIKILQKSFSSEEVFFDTSKEKCLSESENLHLRTNLIFWESQLYFSIESSKLWRFFQLRFTYIHK